MSWHESQPDPLDDLLQKAQWPEAQAEQLDRLRLGWRRTVRRRKIQHIGAAAAAVLIPVVGAVGLFVAQENRRAIEQPVAEMPKQHPVVVEHRQPPEGKLVVEVRPDAPPSDSGPVSASDSQIVREPTAYEQALARMQRRHIATKSIASQRVTQPSDETDEIAAAVERLTGDPQLSPMAVAQDLALKSPQAEPRLRRWLQGSSGSDAASRDAAMRILAVLATQESAPVLLAALRRDDCPMEVVQAVARLSTPQQLVARAGIETSAERRQLWLVALLERGTAQAVGQYLVLVNSPATSTAALAAVKNANSIPIDELFATMQHPRVPMRVAAARVLGTLSDPAISRRLAEMAMNPATRREALLGLTHSSDFVAKQFLVYAQHDLSLSASVRAISKFAAARNADDLPNIQL